MKSVQPFIQRKVVILHEDDSVQQAARAMKDHRIGCVVVADHRSHIVGIATDRDIVLKGFGQPGRRRPMTLAEVMSRDPAAVDEDATLDRVIELMQERGVRRVPVIHASATGTQRCLGLVTLDDLIAAGAVSVERLARVVRSQLARRFIPERMPAEVSQEREAFLRRLSDELGPDPELDAGRLELLAKTCLGALVRRLHHTGALRFIAALPAFLQTDLLVQATGPEDAVTLDWLRSELCGFFDIDEVTAGSMLVRFGVALDDWCDARELEHVKAQLPQDLKSIFARPRPKEALKKAA